MHRYIPRSEVYHLCIYTDKEVVFLHNYDLIPPSPKKIKFLFRKLQKIYDGNIRFELQVSMLKPKIRSFALLWGL